MVNLNEIELMILVALHVLLVFNEVASLPAVGLMMWHGLIELWCIWWCIWCLIVLRWLLLLLLYILAADHRICHLCVCRWIWQVNVMCPITFQRRLLSYYRFWPNVWRRWADLDTDASSSWHNCYIQWRWFRCSMYHTHDPFGGIGVIVRRQIWLALHSSLAGGRFSCWLLQQSALLSWFAPCVSAIRRFGRRFDGDVFRNQ